MKNFKIESETLKKVTSAMNAVKGFATFTVGVANNFKKEGKITTNVRVVSGGAQVTYAFFVDNPDNYEEIVNEDKTVVPYTVFTVEASDFIVIVNTLANYGEAVTVSIAEGNAEVVISSAQASVKLPLVEEDKIPLPLPANYSEGFAMVTVDTKNFMVMVRKGASLTSDDKDTSGIGKIKSFSLIDADRFVSKSTNLFALERSECIAETKYSAHNLANELLEEKIASIKGDEAKNLAERKAACTDPNAIVKLATEEGIDLNCLDFCLNVSAFDTFKAVLGIDNPQKFMMIVTKNYLHISAGSCMCTVTLANKMMRDVYGCIDTFLNNEEYLEVTVDTGRLLNDLAVLGLNKDKGIGVNIRLSDEELVFTRAGSKVVTPIVNKAGKMDLDVFYNVDYMKEVVSSLDKGNMTLRFFGNVHPVIIRNGEIGGTFETMALIAALNPEIAKKNTENETDKS